MSGKFSFLILVPAFLSLAGTLKEQLKDFEPSNGDERAFRVAAPDGEWGQPFFLYSKKGTPYRCYLSSEGLPLSCRRTESGEETLEALKNRPDEFKKIPK